MPISFKNLILSAFDFLLTVISLSIFNEDSLNLKGNTLNGFCSYRERDLDESLSLEFLFFLVYCLRLSLFIF